MEQIAPRYPLISDIQMKQTKSKTKSFDFLKLFICPSFGGQTKGETNEAF